MPPPEERRGPRKKNKGRKKRGERPLSPVNKVHIDKFIRSELLVQDTEGYVVEAEARMETEEERRKPVGDIFSGRHEAQRKAENFMKRQELKELERIIEKKEGDKDKRKEEERTERRWVGEEDDRRSRYCQDDLATLVQLSCLFRRREDRSGWSWSSGVEEQAGQARRGPPIDFGREIKMPPVEVIITRV